MSPFLEHQVYGATSPADRVTLMLSTAEPAENGGCKTSHTTGYCCFIQMRTVWRREQSQWNQRATSARWLQPSQSADFGSGTDQAVLFLKAAQFRRRSGNKDT